MYALITGGSKGIGKEMALILAEKGYNILLVARNEAELNGTKEEIKSKYQVQVLCLALDLSLANSPKQIFDWVKNENISFSILINNAGYGLWGYFDQISLQNQQSMMLLNMNSLVELTYLFLPILKTKPQAYILNVASTASYQAVPGLGVYSATKAFVLSFSRALQFELKKTAVSVTCLSPGATSTNFTNRAGMSKSADLQATADKFSMPADVVAQFGIDAMFAKKNEVIPGFVNKLTVFATYFLPKRIIETIAANLYLKNIK